MSTNFGIASDYNLFTFGNCTMTGISTWGKVAVGGNATFTNVITGIYTPAPPYGTVDSLVVQGNLTWNSGENRWGNTVVYPSSTYSISGVTYTNANSGIQPLRTTPIDFTAAQQYLTCASTQWGAIDATGTAVVQAGTNKLILTGTSSTLNIFSFNGANIGGSGYSLQTVSGIDIVAPLNSTILINISGTSVGFGSYTMTRNGSAFSLTDDDWILFNFHQATTLTFGTLDVRGHVLAPYAAVTATGAARVFGQTMVNTFYSIALAGSVQPYNYWLSASFPEVCTAPASGCCAIGVSNVDVVLTGEGAVITIEGLVNNVRFCDVTDFIAVGLSIYDTSSGTNVPLGRQFVKVHYSGPVPFVPGCYDLPFISKFIYVGDMCGTDPVIAVNTMAQYVCNSVDF